MLLLSAHSRVQLFPTEMDSYGQLDASAALARTALGGRLQRGCRFCFAAHDGEVTTSRLAEWLRPEIVYFGGKPSRWRMRAHRRALKSIGAVKVRRIG